MNGRPRSGLIAGSTGLVGGFLLERLLEDASLYGEVTALVRRDSERRHDKLRTAVVDFEKLEDQAELFRVDDVFCCLGTTIKKAGSEKAFRRVDLEYVEEVAGLGAGGGARRFLLVSSIGAGARSGNFYLSVKGAAEDAVAACGYDEVHVFRPGILDGSRQESRPGERAGLLVSKLVAPLLVGPVRRYRPIHARTVAAAMVAAARSGRAGRHVYTFAEMMRLGS